MSSILSANYLTPNAVETIPRVLNFTPPESHSIITGRTTTRTYPVAGVAFGDAVGANNILEFVIRASDLVDPSTIRLNFFHQALQANGTPSVAGTVQLDDFAQSVIKNLRSWINGQDAEVQNNYAVVWNYLTYATVPKTYYEGQMNAMEGAYKYHSIPQMKYRAQDWARYGHNYSIPIHSGIFRIKTLLMPMEIRLQIELDSFTNSHVVTDAGAAHDASTYKLTDVYLTYDVVKVIPQWYQAFEMSKASPQGLVFSFESYENQPQVMNTVNSMLTFQAGKLDVRSLLVLFRRAYEVSDVNSFSKTTSRRANIGSYQIKLNDMQFPMNPCESMSLAFALKELGCNQLSSIDAGTLMDYDSWANADYPPPNTGGLLTII